MLAYLLCGYSRATFLSFMSIAWLGALSIPFHADLRWLGVHWGLLGFKTFDNFGLRFGSTWIIISKGNTYGNSPLPLTMHSHATQVILILSLSPNRKSQPPLLLSLHSNLEHKGIFVRAFSALASASNLQRLRTRQTNTPTMFFEPSKHQGSMVWLPWAKLPETMILAVF
jgi:hypothetical protein